MSGIRRNCCNNFNDMTQCNEKDNYKPETAIFKAQKKRQVIVKVQHYAELVVPSMSDETFRDILG